MHYKVVKVLAAILFIFVLVNIYGYFWGGMYGGRHYQRKAYIAEAKILLDEYRKDQNFFFKKNKKFDKGLHISGRYEEEYKKFKLGFNDISNVAKYCSDCSFNEQSYKIAAYGQYMSEDIVLTMDSDGNATTVKE